MGESKKAKKRDAIRFKNTLGVEFRLFEMRGARKEPIVTFKGKLDFFWKFLQDSLEPFR